MCILKLLPINTYFSFVNRAVIFQKHIADLLPSNPRHFHALEIQSHVHVFPHAPCTES